MSAGTEATPDFDNPEVVQAIEDDAQRREEERREELSQAEKDKRAILSAVEEETCHVRIMGTRVEFQLLTGDAEDAIEDIAAQFMGVDEDEDDLDAEQYEAYQSAKTNMLDILADHTVAETFDRAFFKQLPSAKREEALMDLREGGIETQRAKN